MKTKVNNFSMIGSPMFDMESVVNMDTIQGIKMKDFIRLAGIEDSIIEFDSYSTEVKTERPYFIPTIEFVKFKIHSF